MDIETNGIHGAGIGRASGPNDLADFPRLVRIFAKGVCTADWQVPVSEIAARLARGDAPQAIAAEFKITAADVAEAHRYVATRGA